MMTVDLSHPDIPITKLTAPNLPTDAIDRRRLTLALAESIVTRLVTLLAAPAGAGKTTTIVAGLGARPGLPHAWMSIDEGDDEPGAFFRLMVVAIQRQIPSFGGNLLHLLQAAGNDVFRPRPMAGLIVNEMVAHFAAPFAIVLDDLHRVSDPRIFHALDAILERAPATAHFVIATRHDPQLRLAQLRSRGQMAEFRMDQLHFGLDEVTNLINKGLGLGLTAEELKRVSERTEGWAAGVRLLAISLSQIDSANERSALIENLSASQRFLSDYLLEEVLNHLEAEDREFVIQTSILDGLVPSICDQVTQRSDSAARLERLYRQNMFLTVQEGDSSQEAQYRYHALFAQFLHKELLRRGQQNYRRLHLLAAQASRRIEDRIAHLLAAEAWEQAAQEIISVGKTQGQLGFIPQQTLEWLHRIPTQVREEFYWLDLIESGWLLQRGQLALAEALALPALSKAEAANDVPGQIEALWNIAFFGTELRKQEYRHRLDEIVAENPGVLQLTRKAYYEISKAWPLIGIDWEGAERQVLKFLELANSMHGSERYNVSSQHLGPQFYFMEKVQPKILEFDRETLRLFGEGEGLAQLGPYARQSWMAFHQGRLADAEVFLQKARRCQQLLGQFAFLDLTLDWLLMDLMLAKGEFQRLDEFVAEAKVRLSSDVQRRNLRQYGLPLWRALWNRDRMQEATAEGERWQKALTEEELRDDPPSEIMSGWTAYAHRDYTAAELHFRRAVAAHRKIRWIGTWGNAGVDLAYFYMLRESKQEALHAWKETAQEMLRLNMPGQPLVSGPKIIPLLELAVREKVYAEVAQVSLRAFDSGGRPQPMSIPGGRESLTSREVEVLRLLAAGASNQDIAERLVITTRTAKAHVSHILQKMQVSSRTEAIARAHEFSLI